MKKFFGILFCLFALNSIFPVFAATLNLYEQPKTDSKVVGTINSESGIIPIFSPQDSGWIKVGDPTNGNVGWLKSTDLNNASSGFTFRVIKTGNGPESYQIVQFGAPQKLSTEQAKNMMKQMELRQKELQKNMQQMMENMFNSKEWNLPNMPVIVPVFMVPHEQNKKDAKTKVTPTETQAPNKPIAAPQPTQ